MRVMLGSAVRPIGAVTLGQPRSSPEVAVFRSALKGFIAVFFVRGALIVGFSALVLAACSRDPNVRKQKYFHSGQKYFENGDYPAAIQFESAIRIDFRFAAAHYQLAQTYLRLGDTPHAYLETEKTVELQPDNSRGRFDLVTMLAAETSASSLKNPAPNAT